MNAMNHEAGAILELTQELVTIWLGLIAGVMIGSKVKDATRYSMIWWGLFGFVGAFFGFMAWQGFFGVASWQAPNLDMPVAQGFTGPVIGFAQHSFKHEYWEWIEGVLSNYGALGALLFGMSLGRKWSIILKPCCTIWLGWTKRHSAFLLGAILVIAGYGLLRVPTFMKTFTEPSNIIVDYFPDVAGCPKLIWLTPVPDRAENLPDRCVWK